MNQYRREGGRREVQLEAIPLGRRWVDGCHATQAPLSLCFWYLVSLIKAFELIGMVQYYYTVDKED